jgi:hypothetical protein
MVKLFAPATGAAVVFLSPLVLTAGGVVAWVVWAIAGTAAKLLISRAAGTKYFNLNFSRKFSVIESLY